MSRSDPYPFAKMHGLGNDFVVIDRRGGAPAMTPELARALADRHRGLGFDQLVEVEDDPDACARLTFWNADGSLSGACGNATRCIAAQALSEAGAHEVAFRTDRGRLTARTSADGVAVNMGPPILDWREIPLAHDVDVDALPIPGAPLATGMGNPHCTFFVDDAEAIDLATFGPAHEHHPLFPERTNVQVAHVAGPDRIRMRVWERGAGLTLASGTSSCATVVAACRRGLTGPRVRVALDGGELVIDWREDGVWMAGPTAHVASGTLTPAFVESVS